MISKSIGLFGVPFLAAKGIESIIRKSEAQFHAYDNLAGFISDAPQHDLLIVGMGQTLSLEITQHIASHRPNIMLVLQTDQIDDFRVLAAKGINAMVNWDCPEEEVMNAILMALKGKKYFCDRLLEQMIQTDTVSKSNSTTVLTERETEVLELIAVGKTTNQVANELHLSNHTINSHRKNIMKKLKLKHPPQLISYAWENGLVTPT